jgi:hypothetical protein
MVFNTGPSTLGSTRFWVLLVCNACAGFLFVILRILGFRDCCMLFRVMCVIVLCCIVLYCALLYWTVLYCPSLRCSTLPPGMNPFTDNNNNNNNNVIWRSGDTAVALPNSALGVGEWLSSCPGRLNPRKELGKPLIRRLRGPQNWPRRRGEVNKILPLPGIEPRFLGRSAYSLVSTGLQTAPPRCGMGHLQLRFAVLQRFNQPGIGRSVEMTSRCHRFYVI